ncbi:translocation/assembly module TamB domain-containing protein [Zestomonas thermotolerans]|uniref:translocation/assembly module TamB domain-containing protein n=1 Tax=Zestomonas thermotolerans TaxID=157784 RepID=UPI0023F3CBEF|nr:translocation/assembly module TamB domain-containing protein [Pseudomonas thermotolerans]
MRAAKRIAWGLLALLLTVALALALLFGTAAGSRWLLGMLPGVEIEDFTGSLGGVWQAERLAWRQDGQRVEVQAPRFAWSPACLLRLTLCLERLQAERLELGFPPGEEPDDAGPFRLPSLRLPLALELGEVRIGAIRLNGAPLLDDAELRASWTAAGLRIERLQLRQGSLALDLQGSLRPEGDWPMELAGSLDLPAPGAQSWRLELQANGDLQGTLELSGRSSGYLAGTLAGELQPLAEHLPAKLEIRADGFRAAAGLPDTLVLNAVQLTGEGDLAAGYRVKGRATLPGEGGEVALRLDGRVDAEGADIASLVLEAGAQQRLSLDGRLDWQDGFAVDGRLDWQDFPWMRLYPLEEPPPVNLRRLKAEVAYHDGNYLGNFAAELDGPAGAFSLHSPVSGDLQQVHLPALELAAGQGKAEGKLGLRFAAGLAWEADLTFSALDPAYWFEELPGRLAGTLRSQGSLRDQQLDLAADLNLDGRLRGQPAALHLQAQGAGNRWQVPRLEVHLGDNRIQGSGELNRQLRGQLDLALPHLGQLWPGLRGQLGGRLDLAGSAAAPQGTFKLEGQRLGLEDLQLRRLDLDASLDAAQRARLNLTASGIRSGDSLFGSLSAQGDGDIRRQRLELQLRGPRLQGSLAFDGRLEEQRGGWDWRGRLARGELSAGQMDWVLQQPARLERLADGRINLGAHCWRSGAASLCGEESRLQPEPKLRFRLRDFPLADLAPWLPDDFAWDGNLTADLQLDLPAGGPKGLVRVDASNGVFRVREQEQWLEFPYGRLLLDSTLAPRRIDSRLDFQGERLGELTAQLSLDPRPANRPLAGDFRLSGLDLAVVRPFLPLVEHLAGQLNGSGRISGGLLAPRIDGALTLSGGEIDGTQLPTSFEDLQLRVQVAGEQLQLAGDWRSGEQGRGSLSGQLNWTGEPEGDLHLRGERLPVNVEPYAALEVEPNLVARLAEGRLAVAGQVRVPRGAIEIRQLPASTVKVSDDAVVVGRAQEEKQQLQIDMDIDVSVGSDKLTFKGFGLTAELLGNLKIGDDLDTRGELRLDKGRYRAYGQRLNIRRARLLFTGPIDQPYLDIEAIRRVDDVVAGLRVSGSAAQPRTQVFSEPAMGEEQALSYLVLGRPLGGGTGEETNLLAQAALGLGLAGGSSVAGSLAQSLGISDFQLDTSGTGQQTSVVASGRITDRLSLRYGVGVFEPANTIALRYELTRRLYLEAASGLASSLDIFYRRDF